MQKKPTGSSTTRTTAATRTLTRAHVSREQVRDALARDTSRLPAEEEKALRMLHGATAPRTLVLERVGQDHPETREKLLGLELELLRQWRERQAARPDPRSETRAAPQAATKAEPANPKRERIVAALKTKRTPR